MRPRHAAPVLVVTLAAVALGCGGGDDERDGAVVAASCAAVLDWRGERYLGSGTRMPVGAGAPLGEATRPACDDGGGAAPEAEVEVARVEGVDPAVALVDPREPTTVYVREGLSLETRPLAPVLERALYGPRCTAREPFVLEGALVGSSNLDEPFSVSIDVDAAEGEAGPYLGFPIALLVRPSATGLNERDEFHPGVGEEWRLRASVRCVEGERPTRTFLAERIERVEEPAVPADLGRLSCPRRGEGPPCEEGAELGASYPFDLYVHCGVRDAYVDGRWWVLSGGSLPRGELRPEAVAHPVVRVLIRLLGEEEAEFTGGGFRLALVPAPPGDEREPCD